MMLRVSEKGLGDTTMADAGTTLEAFFKMYQRFIALTKLYSGESTEDSVQIRNSYCSVMAGTFCKFHNF